MFQTTQTFHPVPAVFATRLVAQRFEGDARPKLPADREWLFDDFVNTLHALVWGAEI